MSFFSDLRAERLIAEIRGIGDPLHPDSQKALQKLMRVGPGAIPKILDALAVADRKETASYVDILAQLIDNKSFPILVQGMVDASPRTISAIGQALIASRNYSANLLIELLGRDDMPKPTILEVIAAQKGRFTVRDLLQHAYSQEPNEKAALFRLVGELADEAALPELISRIEGKDASARIHIINILARYNRPEVSQAIQTQLRDPNKMIRQAALNALSKMDGPVNIGPICQLLRDPDLEVANRAIDVVVRAKDPDTMSHLIDVLKDENEYARRAGVEVLNHLGTANDIKHLLQVIKDDDWWVRTRAADALGKIGGPRVVDAVIELIRDDDEDVRRAAIEILNQTKDERAVNFLIEATKDKDWWVSERAVDALAEIGSKKAVPALVELLKTDNTRSLPTVARALGKLGDTRVIEPLVTLLDRPEKEIKVEVINALARLADEKRADAVRAHIQSAGSNTNDPTIEHAAVRAIEDIDLRYSSTAVAAAIKAGRTHIEPTRSGKTLAGEPARTLLIDRGDVDQVIKKAEEAAAATAKLDIGSLKPGDVVEGRYKFIEKIGKGAFGTVLLMEDTVVEERLILKFLNPNVAQDEEMMKRFVHELRYSRKITHRNVIRIYDFLYMRGNYAISMEYFPSHTLGSEIVNEKPLPLPRAIKYGIDICTGMTIAHQAGIVHRDLKPANILINNEGLLKIVDFGVAAAQKEGDTQLTKTGYVIGSPKYMAPEQILGKKVDDRADIYSVGVILYEMLTGVPPYSRGDHMSVMYQHVQGKAKSAIEVNPQLPKHLSDLVAKAMAVDKAKRFQSMDELRVALEQALR
ncbi:HEAT repeat domain-containing protein [Steroidobacter sp. S1-65]|uniref:HEAT repeat domain-containing protein n=1 Tax=Steroidobacter gossypii TaxID=2805490 RepID=A0ABS1X660_9GAMM|nr:HEAT repeat domain-containing protein [Steroidobacter gossypii]MBM0108711.1 HEAT repeat domain-containing protein [Steroidobacter gossypii]